MAANSYGLKDKDGDYSDWIELWNNGNEAVSLDGWGLSNSADTPYEWVLPEITILPDARIVVFASGKDLSIANEELHTNFKLSSSGEYLALTNPNGKVISQFSPYPQQYPDVSYGISASLHRDYHVQNQSSFLYSFLEDSPTDYEKWTAADYDDSHFSQGKGGIGFEKGNTETVPAAADAIQMLSPSQYWRMNETVSTLKAYGGVSIDQLPTGSEESLSGFGEDNKCYYLDGETGSYLSAEEPLLNNLSAFTVMGWIYPTTTVANRTGLFGQNDAIEFGIVSRNQFHFWCSGGPSMYGNIEITPNTWHFVAAVGTGDYTFIYFDGEIISKSYSYTSTYGSSNFPFTIGGRTFDESGGEFKGAIDEVAVFNNGLELTDLDKIYNAAKQGMKFETFVSNLQPAGYFRLNESNSKFENSGTENCMASGVGTITHTDGPLVPEFLGLGDSNPAVYFNGRDTRINIDYQEKFNGDEFSISAWVNPMEQNVIAPIFSSRDYNPHVGYVLMIDENKEWGLALATATDKFTSVAGGKVQYGVWSLVTATYDGKTARIYVNGAETANLYVPGFIPNTPENRKFSASGQQRIGYGAPTVGTYFLGSIDEIICLNRVLNASECKALYDIAKTGQGTSTMYYLTSSISTDITGEMPESSLFTRYHFNLNSVSSIKQLTLKIKYIDGFAAWLNGKPILSENTPAELAFDSFAISHRQPKLGATAVQYNISGCIDFLQTGDNILAIQGMRTRENDSCFLIQSELSSVSEQSAGGKMQYFKQPTPGEANSQGEADLGPIIDNVTSIPVSPSQPSVNDPIIVSACVTPSESALSNISLFWKVMYGSEKELRMNDNGEDGDQIAADGIYTATIPANSAKAGEMIRWRIVAEDVTGRSSSCPLNPTKDSSEYLGTVILDENMQTKLPVLHLFSQSTGAYGTISAFYNGELYDNITISSRGQTTSGFPKRPYKIAFNKDHRFLYSTNGTDQSRVKKVNLMSNHADKSKIRNSLSYEYIHKSGSVGHWSFPVRVNWNGNFYSVAEMLENGDEDYLTREGLDENGALYKIYNPLTTAGGNEKKTRKDEGIEDLSNLVYQISASKTFTNRVKYVYDNVNIPQTISYFASLAIISSQDHGHKNYYLYCDTERSKEWSILPWDVDLSFGRNWLDSGGYFTDTIYTNNILSFYNYSQQSKTANPLYDIFFNDAGLRMMYLTRLRTLLDDFFVPHEEVAAAVAPTIATGENTEIAKSVHKMLDRVDPSDFSITDADRDAEAWKNYRWGSYYTMSQDCQRIIDLYVPGRRAWLNSPSGGVLNGTAIPAATPDHIFPIIDQIELNTAGSNALHKYVRISNTNSVAIDISDWKLSGTVQFTFKPGTVILSGKSIYITPSLQDFRERSKSPTTNECSYVVGNWKGNLPSRGGKLVLENRMGQVLCEYEYEGTTSELQKYLRITEVMYNPLPMTPDWSSQDLEFVELQNISTNSILNLKNAAFTKGIDYTFGGTLLFPGQRIVLVKNKEAFQARYGTSVKVAGVYTGSLNNSGETICLTDANSEIILEFTYKDTWQPLTDGLGYSLVCNDIYADWTLWDSKLLWSHSNNLHGSPGASEPEPSEGTPKIKINEALIHAGTGEIQAIELYNPEQSDVNIGGWYISDSPITPKKYKIPSSCTIPADGYCVLTAKDLAGSDEDIFQRSFGEIWLFDAKTSGVVGEYTHGVFYSLQNQGITFGLIKTSTEEEYFAPQKENTLGFPNKNPLILPPVIEEVMYHPLQEIDDITAEYIKLVNTQSIPLSCKGIYFTTGIDFAFADDTEIPAKGVLLVVSFDPLNDLESLNKFMEIYSITNWNSRVKITGPYSGKLSNSGETIEMAYQVPTIGSNPEGEIILESLTYGDSDPWPGKADGKGQALKRKSLSLFANDPVNWSSKKPTPNLPPELEIVIKEWIFTNEFLIMKLSTPPDGFILQTSNTIDAVVWISVPFEVDGTQVTVLHENNPLFIEGKNIFYRFVQK